MANQNSSFDAIHKDFPGKVVIEISLEDLEIHTQNIVQKTWEAARQSEVKTPEEYLTQDQVCKILSISPVTAWSWRKKGIIKGLRIGNQVRYKLSDIENSMQEISGKGDQE